jgi:hypothetical protein
MRELLYGARPVDTLPTDHMGEWDPSITEAVTLADVGLHYALFEIATQDGIDNLPPSLHPTWPGLLSVMFMRVPESPVGPFTFGAFGVAARTSIKPRQIVLSAFADTGAARDLLTGRYGYPIQVADVRQQEFTDAVISTIDVDGERIVDLTTDTMHDLSGTSAALKIPPHLNLAHVGTEQLLLQTEFGFLFHRTRRGTPRIAVRGSAIGLLSDLPLSVQVAGSHGKVDVTLNPARFALDPEQPAEQAPSLRLSAPAGA